MFSNFDLILKYSLSNISPEHKTAARSTTLESDRFFGEFGLHPSAKLGDIAHAYGFDIDPASVELTIEQYFSLQFHGKPVVGDQVKLGQVKLIIREIKDEQITSVGLKLGQQDTTDK